MTQPYENTKLKSLESNEFFSGMNVNKADNDPNGYNPPDLFAGLSMSIGGGGGGKNQTSTPMNFGTEGGFNMSQSQAPTFQPLQNTGGGFMNTQNTQMNFGMQNTQQPVQFPMSSMDMFSGMNLSGSFSPAPIPQSSNSIQNTSTEFVNINKSREGIAQENIKLDQTKSTDNSFQKDSQPKQEASSGYNPPDLFANLNISTHNATPKEESNELKPSSKEQTSSAPGFWSNYKNKDKVR